MIDIHTHILPNVDDGSSSLEVSLAMVKHELSIGVNTIICTPHHILHRYDKTVEEIKQSYKLLTEEVKRQNLPVTILLGQEICYTHREDAIKLLQECKLLTLNNTNYVLLEFSFTREPEDITDIIYNFSIKGYKVIVAHVERYNWITLDKVMSLKSEGAIIQVNSGAIIGAAGWKEKRFSHKLLKKGLVDVIASDVHSFRYSTLDKAYKKVKNPKLFEFKLD